MVIKLDDHSRRRLASHRLAIIGSKIQTAYIFSVLIVSMASQSHHIETMRASHSRTRESNEP